MDVAKDVRFGPRLSIQVQAGSHNRIVMGPGCQIDDGVQFQLKGGTLDFGERVEVRRGTVINLAGTFRCVGRNILSYHNVIHCAEHIELDLYASTNEFVSIIDSTHHHDGTAAFFYENVSAAPISIGRNSWICNKSSVLLGVRIGHNCVLASHAVANRDVPDGMVAGGVPARIIGPRQVGGPALELFDPPDTAGTRADA